MTPLEEKQIDNHIWNSLQTAFITFWSILEKDKTFYRESISILLNGGDVKYEPFGKEDMSGLTQILAHLGLPFQHIANGIRLNDDAKIRYKENKMIRKPYIPPVYEKKHMSIGKPDKYDGRLGWAEQILLNNKKEREEQENKKE